MTHIIAKGNNIAAFFSYSPVLTLKGPLDKFAFMNTPYQIIPRKYRPQTFKSMVGQEAIVTTLKNALRFKKFAHAYLFCGSRGTGKTTLARLFAKALNCQNLREDQEPCNECPSCKEVASGRSLDVLEIDGASNRGIDDIRQINETVGYAAASGKYKIYIIDEVHMLTKEAFNALLKTLEEPPLNVKFFFATTEPHKMLPTIISRCQRFDLCRIPLPSIEKKLAEIAQDLGVDIEKSALRLIAEQAEGSLRDAESLLDQVICYTEGAISCERVSLQLGLMPESTYLELDDAIHNGRLLFAFELAEKIFSSGKDPSSFIEGLMEHFRTHLFGKLQSPAAGSLYTQDQLLYILDFLVNWSQQMAKSPFKRVGLEMIFLHLVRSRHRITIDSLVKRLSELEEGSAKPSEESVIKKTIAEPPVPVQAAPTPAPVVETAPKPSLEEKLLSAIKTKINSPPPSPPPEVKVKVETPKITSTQEQVKYDTMLQFAAVELEGTIKR